MKVISFITARTFMMNNTLITFNDISKKFVNGEHTTCVLDNVNLSIESGDFVSIVGRSGSGKSTLISLLGFLDIPTYGDYFYEGKNTSLLSQYDISSLRNKDFGFIFQSYNLISHLSVLDNVILPATYSPSFCLSTVTERAYVLLKNLGLSSEKNKLPKQLSGGQQQRVSIARALINDPKVIIADEPTGALDKASSDVVLSVLKKLNRQGKTIILVTHDETLTQFSNKIFRFSDLGFKVEKTESSKSSFCERGSCNVNPPPPYTRWFTSNKILIKNTLQVLNVHRVRTILSMLGIVIGIMSLVIVTSIGNSAQLKIVEDLEKFGSRIVTLSSNYNTTNSYQLSDSQFQFLSGFSTVQYSSPIYKATVPIDGVKNHDEINFVGVKNDYFFMNEMELLKGRYFHIIDVQNKKFVGLIDIATSDKLFNGRNPIGKSVFTDKKKVVIIGVIKNKIGFTDPNQELKIYLPYTTLNNESESRVSYLFQPFKNANFSYATSLIEKYVTIWHGVDKFWVFNNDSARGTVTRITDTITSFVSIVALISLLVGGIGIMNVMLVSVYERTKEIGIRLSFGATTRHISIQFLIESVFICFLSAILGVIFSFLFIELFDFLYKDLEVSISIISIILAAFSSVFVGLIFGFAPAFKASKLSPMRALTT